MVTAPTNEGMKEHSKRKAAEISNSGAISNASSGHFMELGIKIFYTTQESAIFLKKEIVSFYCSLHYLVPNWHSKRTAKYWLMSPSSFAKSCSPPVDHHQILWRQSGIYIVHRGDPSSVPGIQKALHNCLTRLTWLSWNGRSEAVGRELRGRSHHPHPLPLSQHDIALSSPVRLRRGMGNAMCCLASSLKSNSIITLP